MILIRQAEYADLPYFYEICLKTGASGKDASGSFYDPYLIGQFYAAPYFFYEKNLCFVSEQGAVPQGYIIAASDTCAFQRWLETEWLPLLRRRYPVGFTPVKSALEEQIVSLINRCAAKEALPAYVSAYPAHLHIDLLPSLQGRGQGRALMETLFGALRARGVGGVHLGVGGDNSGAIAFYRKLGFSLLVEKEWGFELGKAL